MYGCMHACMYLVKYHYFITLLSQFNRIHKKHEINNTRFGYYDTISRVLSWRGDIVMHIIKKYIFKAYLLRCEKNVDPLETDNTL